MALVPTLPELFTVVATVIPVLAVLVLRVVVVSTAEPKAPAPVVPDGAV